MRLLLLIATVGAPWWAPVVLAQKPTADVSHTPAFSVTPPASAASNHQATVLAWLQEVAPDYPADLAVEVAARFTEQLTRYHSTDAEQLGGPSFPTREYEPLLLQMAGARLSAPTHASQREALAAKRVQAALAHEGSAASATDAQNLLAQIKTRSAASHRRLIEGRMEEEELRRLARPERADSETKTKIVAGPKALTTAEIQSEFARRNQSGAAAARLRAYVVESKVRNSDGSEQTLQLFKRRPDLFRLQAQGAPNNFVLAFDGTRYWRQIPGKAEVITPTATGPLRHAGEFLDLLFEPGDARLARVDDAAVDGRPCYQLQITRADGSSYVAQLDQENYHVVGRQEPDGRKVRYSDFREVAGLTLAHREEVTYPDGRTSVMEITKLTANPGLVSAFFTLPLAGQLDLFSLEKLLAFAPATDGRTP